MACTSPRGLINAATFLGPLVIVFIVLGFATDHWTETDVDRSKLSTIMRSLGNSNQEIARIYHSRHRGIIRECYPKDSATFLAEAQNVVNGDCFYVDFDDPEGISMSEDYNSRMHIIRSILATYVFGMVGVILAFILGVVLCCVKNCYVAHVASGFACFGGMFVLASIVLFHAQEYVEANEEGEPGEIIFHENWSEDLLKATDSDLGYSYALAWVGFILAMTDGILYLLAARALRLQQVIDDGSSDSSSTTDRRKVIKNSRHQLDANYAYDNYGMKYATALPGPMFVEGYPPTVMQTMPAYPSLSYGQSVYRMSDGDYSGRET